MKYNKNKLIWVVLFLAGIVFAMAKPSRNIELKNYDEYRYALADLADHLMPVVVSIKTESKVKQPQFNSFWEQFFFGPQQQMEPRSAPRTQGLGSGVIVSGDGYIITNNHVVENAEVITVTLHDQREFKAKIVGTDPQTDVAVIKLDKSPKNLPLAKLGSSESLRVGERIMAIGSPYGLNHTVTTGIVSAKGVHNRGITSYENFIQTDAAINPGNSGGGLFNLAGELVGINTAILSRSGGFQGIGFAIPADLAHSIMSDLVQTGKVSRGWLGVGIQNVDPKIAQAMGLSKIQGALISEVFDDSPAQKAGLQSGDVVLQINDIKISDANLLRHEVAKARAGQKVRFVVLRNGKQQTLTVTIGSRESAPGEFGFGSEVQPTEVLGLELSDLDSELRRQLRLKKNEQGVLVQSVKANSVAEASGIVAQDVILQVGNQPVENVRQFRDLVNKSAAGQSLVVLLKRGNSRLFTVLEKE